MGDTSWFPKPRVKPVDKPPSMTRLLAGTLLPVIAIAGVVIALSNSKSRPSNSAKAVSTLKSTLSVSDSRDARRQAFNDCMKSMDAGSPGVRGRFGRVGGPSQKYREAITVCSSLLRDGGDEPAPPTRTVPSSSTAPVA